MEHLLSTEIPSDRGFFRIVQRILTGAIPDGSEECERSKPRIGVPWIVDLPSELTDLTGSNSLKVLNFHRN
jgi:hypothetical protein